MRIVADTGAIVALIDRSDRHHEVLRNLFVSDPSAWVLPWSILPEVDYIVAKHLGRRIETMFVSDLADGTWWIEWGVAADLSRARELVTKHESLELGLVDATVMAVAERLGAGAIATLDVRDFGAVELAGSPALLPRDL